MSEIAKFCINVIIVDSLGLYLTLAEERKNLYRERYYILSALIIDRKIVQNTRYFWPKNQLYWEFCVISRPSFLPTSFPTPGQTVWLPNGQCEHSNSKYPVVELDPYGANTD